jgi:hypothetical protein
MRVCDLLIFCRALAHSHSGRDEKNNGRKKKNNPLGSLRVASHTIQISHKVAKRRFGEREEECLRKVGIKQFEERVV